MDNEFLIKRIQIKKRLDPDMNKTAFVPPQDEHFFMNADKEFIHEFNPDP
jgi:hypothetical protein